MGMHAPSHLLCIRWMQVSSINRRSVQRSPPAPFITSTLQQAASTKLGFSAVRTMALAQQLYEGAGRGGVRGQVVRRVITNKLIAVIH